MTKLKTPPTEIVFTHLMAQSMGLDHHWPHVIETWFNINKNIGNNGEQMFLR